MSSSVATASGCQPGIHRSSQAAPGIEAMLAARLPMTLGSSPSTQAVTQARSVQQPRASVASTQIRMCMHRMVGTTT